MYILNSQNAALYYSCSEDTPACVTHPHECIPRTLHCTHIYSCVETYIRVYAYIYTYMHVYVYIESSKYHTLLQLHCKHAWMCLWGGYDE